MDTPRERLDDEAPADVGDLRDIYFKLQAEFDFTKHIGALDATDEIAALTGITVSSNVLDVGCGVGMTATYLAKRFGCYVVGIDVREDMVARAKERAEREGMGEKVEFRVADAGDLPFEHDAFDVVMCESVLALVDDQAAVLGEMKRVLKPGGHLGATEASWFKLPPPGLVEQLEHQLGRMDLHPPEGWREVIQRAGFDDVAVIAHDISVASEGKSRIKRYGLGHILRIWGHVLSALVTRPEYRAFLKEAMSDSSELLEYWGYVVAVARKS